MTCALTLAAPACSTEVAYIYATYSKSSPTVVTIGCGDPYELFDSTDKKVIMVRSYALSELSRGACASTGLREAAPLRARAKQAAEAHLAKTARPRCVVGEGRPLSALEWEFAYTC